MEDITRIKMKINTEETRVRMKAAEVGSFYLWPEENTLGIAASIARIDCDRPDLTLVGPRWLRQQKFKNHYVYVVVDPSIFMQTLGDTDADYWLSLIELGKHNKRLAQFPYINVNGVKLEA